jgi:hypothetical protein
VQNPPARVNHTAALLLVDECGKVENFACKRQVNSCTWRCKEKRRRKTPGRLWYCAENIFLLFLLHRELDVLRNFPVQLHRNFVLAHDFDRLGEDNPLLVNLKALGSECLGDVTGCD